MKALPLSSPLCLQATVQVRESPLSSSADLVPQQVLVASVTLERDPGESAMFWPSQMYEACLPAPLRKS